MLSDYLQHFCLSVCPPVNMPTDENDLEIVSITVYRVGHRDFISSQWVGTSSNKSAQSNLGRGPRRGTVAHVRRKVPIGYNGAPQIRRQKYPFPWTDPETPLPASSLDPSELWCQTASGSDPPFFHNALDRPTDARKHVRTDRQIVHGKVWSL